MTGPLRAARTDLGVKRRCGACAAPFYDLSREPIQCPKCGVAFNANAPSKLPNSPRRLKPSRTPVRNTKVQVVKPETAESPEKTDEPEESAEAEREDGLLDVEEDT